MRKQKKIRLIPIIIVLLVPVLLFNIFSKKDKRNNEITEELICEINEKYFNIDINLDNKTVTADGNTYAMTDFFNINEKAVQGLINSGKIANLLNEKSIGKVQTNENILSVENPFSTKALIVETDNISVISQDTNVIKLKNLVDNVYLVKYKTAVDTKNAYLELRSNSKVKNVVYDYKLSAEDSQIESASISENNIAWGVKSTGLNHYASKMNYLGSDAIKVAVLDTGINQNHEVFTQNSSRICMDGAYDYVNSDDNPADDNGHGTLVSGVVFEATSDNVEIVPVKIMGSDGKGITTALLDAITDLYTRVDIINISLGGDPTEIDSESYDYMDRVFKKASDYGTILVCSAGNEGSIVSFPACSQYTLSAAAINANGVVSSFSNHGPEVDFALPGEALRLPNYANNTGYKLASGTSFSCPFLSSAIAMIKSENPTYSQANIVNVLKANAIDSGDEGKDDYYGYGSVAFNYNMFATPEVIGCNTQDSEWSTYNTISVFAIASKNITSYAISTVNQAPDTWINIPASSSEVVIDNIRANSNGLYYVFVKDEDGNVSEAAIVEISYVDGQIPNVTEFTSNSVGTNNITVKITAQDEGSGLSEIKWYHKKIGDVVYNEASESIEATEHNQVTTTQTFENLDGYTEYEIFAEVYDNVGNCVTTSKLNVKTLGEISIVNKTNHSADVSYGSTTSDEDCTITYSDDIITVSCVKDYCVLAVNDNSCVKLEPTQEDANKYRFNGAENTSIVIALKYDANLNGTVNVMDAMQIINIINGDEVSETARAMSDVNSNNLINVMDAMYIIDSLKNN